jgi:hypothetical protein
MLGVKSVMSRSLKDFISKHGQTTSRESGLLFSGVQCDKIDEIAESEVSPDSLFVAHINLTDAVQQIPTSISVRV